MYIGTYLQSKGKIYRPPKLFYCEEKSQISDTYLYILVGYSVHFDK